MIHRVYAKIAFSKGELRKTLILRTKLILCRVSRGCRRVTAFGVKLWLDTNKLEIPALITFSDLNYVFQEMSYATLSSAIVRMKVIRYIKEFPCDTHKCISTWLTYFVVHFMPQWFLFEQVKSILTSDPTFHHISYSSSRQQYNTQQYNKRK